MQDEQKELASAEENTTAATSSPDAAKHDELEEVARRVVNAEHEKWEKQRKRKKRKRRLIGFGIVFLLIIVGAISAVVKFASSPIVVNEETIPILSPIDAEDVARIDAMEGYSPDDTWTFYLYVVGSDLESGNSNHLSDITKLMIQDEVNAIKTAQVKDKQENILQLSNEISENGLELPYCLFAPNRDWDLSFFNLPIPSLHGCATTDLRDYMSVPLPENVQFVIQTGGAPAWADADINPNRTQRFLLNSDGLREIYNGPITNMGHPDTLADFLKFGAETYPADHEVVILWNHGAAYDGFGYDNIYGDILSLPELKEAFAAAFPLDKENPPLEMVYFACCIMSNAEVLDYMEGTAKYVVAAEEVTYGVPNSTACSDWLKKFVENTGINGAQLGKIIIDSYIECMLEASVSAKYVLPTSLSLLDMRSAGEVYDAYGDFAQAALKAQIEDPFMVSKIADSASSSVFLALTSYKGYNLVDLTLFMENAAEYFPKEAKAVIDLIDDTVLYTRATEYLRDAGGISIYYPYHLETGGAIAGCLSYLDTVSQNMDINAMYYYKMTGCMNDTYTKHCVDSGYGTAQTLRYNELYRLHDVAVDLDEKGDMHLDLTDVEYLLLQDAVYNLTLVDDDKLIYLGEDRYVDVESRPIFTEFPATWIAIDGVPFALEVINTDDEHIHYTTPIEYRSMRRDLVLKYNFETEKITVLGIRNSSEYEAATLDRSTEPLEYGEKITPIYVISDSHGGNLSEKKGKTVRFTDADSISDAPLKDGTYIARIKMEDMRSDQYYSQPIRLIVENGKVKEATPETEYRVSNHR